MVQTPKMTFEEKLACYMKSTKKKLAEMLIECNRMLDVRRQEESIITQDKASNITASYNFNEPTRREKIATHILPGMVTNSYKYSSVESIIKYALVYTDELIKQLDE